MGGEYIFLNDNQLTFIDSISDQNTTFEIRMLMNIKEIKDGCIIKLEIQKRKIYFL